MGRHELDLSDPGEGQVEGCCECGNEPSGSIKCEELYIHGSVHHESNLITVQQDATLFSLLYFCRQLYMFRVLTPIIRSSYNYNYSFWY